MKNFCKEFLLLVLIFGALACSAPEDNPEAMKAMEEYDQLAHAAAKMYCISYKYNDFEDLSDEQYDAAAAEQEALLAEYGYASIDDLWIQINDKQEWIAYDVENYALEYCGLDSSELYE